MSLRSYPPNLHLVEMLGNILSFSFHVILPFFILPFKTAGICMLILISMMGLAYFLNVAPNHDTISTHDALSDKQLKGMDWGELQVRSSCNHSIGNSLIDQAITNLWGGMNYQIEHHLFPAMSHCHYSTISPIVRETCKEFGIPYSYHENWYKAIVGYTSLLKLLETN